VFGVGDSTAALAFGNSNSFSFSTQQQPLWRRTSDGSNIFSIISDSAARDYTRAAFGFEDTNETAPFQRLVTLVVWPQRQSYPRSCNQPSASAFSTIMRSNDAAARTYSLNFSFSYGAACSSSNIVSFSFGLSCSFSDDCKCSLAAAALHSGGSSEQLSPRLTFQRQLGESYSSSLYLSSCSGGDFKAT
jgi:hypothetical protein